MTSDPVLIAFAVRRSKNGKARWTRIGEAYPHDIGAGLTIKLDSMPLDGVVILLERDDHDDARLSRELMKSGWEKPQTKSRKT